MESRDERPVQRPLMGQTTTSGHSLCAMRVVRGKSAMVVVYESTLANGQRALTFEFADTKREIEVFPAGWRKLSDTELMSLVTPL